MKRFNLNLLITLFLFSACGLIFPQNNDESSVRSTLKNIIDYSKSKSYDKAAVLIAYDGDDKARIGNDTFNSTNKDDMIQVKRICKKISALIDISDKYSVSKVDAAKVDGMDGYKALVIFTSGDQELETEFEFIKLAKGYALLNVN